MPAPNRLLGFKSAIKSFFRMSHLSRNACNTCKEMGDLFPVLPLVFRVLYSPNFSILRLSKKSTLNAFLAAVHGPISCFKDELRQFLFPEKTVIGSGKVMGFKEHRITGKETTLCDLVSYSLDHLFKKGYFVKEKMGTMIVVSQQDHPLPGNSKMIHGQSKLPREVHCVGMCGNCIGCISSFYNAFPMFSSGAQF